MNGWGRGDDERYLPTLPGTHMEFSAASPARRRPCWRCRLHLRWRPWRRHWQCRRPPVLEYLP